MIIDNAIMHNSRLLVHMMDDPQNTDGLEALLKLMLVMCDRDVMIDLSCIEENLSDQDKNTLSAIEACLREAGHQLVLREVPDQVLETLSTLGLTKTLHLHESCA
jgi:hypothetical protein